MHFTSLVVASCEQSALESQPPLLTRQESKIRTIRMLVLKEDGSSLSRFIVRTGGRHESHALADLECSKLQREQALVYSKMLGMLMGSEELA